MLFRQVVSLSESGATVKRVFATSLCCVAASVLLAGCGDSSPQACRELKPAVDSYAAASAAYESDGSQLSAQVFIDATEELGRTALAVSETSSAREEGIAEDLRNFAMAMSRFDEEGAGALAGITNYSIKEVCGFSMFGDESE